MNIKVLISHVFLSRTSTKMATEESANCRRSPRKSLRREMLLNKQAEHCSPMPTESPNKASADPVCLGAKTTVLDLLPRTTSKRSRRKTSHIFTRLIGQTRKTAANITCRSVPPYLQGVVPDEVILNILSFLQAKDVCSLARACQRFSKICKDARLWGQLYTSTFDLDYCLKKTERGLFEKVDVITKDTWRDGFRVLANSYHVYCGDLSKKTKLLGSKKVFSSINEAVSKTPENSLIMVHPGVYKEFLVINKPVNIIGAGLQGKSEVVIEGTNATVLKFVAGSGNSYVRNINIKFVGNDEIMSRPSCIEVGPQCNATIHLCSLSSQANAGSTIYVHGNNARPRVIGCSITDSENVGIFVNSNAQGTYEDNEISNSKLAGVWVKNGASPVMRNNKIHHGRDVGFFIFDNGQGYFDGNDVYSNRIAGFEVRTGGNPTVVHCKIHHGLTGGIYVHDEGRGEFLQNKIYANTFAGIWVASRSNPTIKDNEIFSGQQGGVYIFGEGRGLIENNNIHSNALAGIQIRSGSNPIVRHNRVHHGLHGGIYVHEGGLGLIEDNEVYSNTLAGVWVTTGSAPIMRNNRIHSGKQVGVYFYDNGGGILEDNEIFNHKYSGIQIRTRSNPVIRRNKIWGGQNGGVLVYNQGLGLLEDNEIFDNAMAGVWIKTESDPILKRNKIHDGKEGGICIFNGGKGLLECNDIFRNSLTGVLISTSSFPVLRGNRIFEGGTTGIEITNGAGGILESNEIFNNKFSGICLATGVKPQLINNILHDNKQVIKKTVDSGCCLYQISGNTCYPMHDFYRCSTCSMSESFAICVNCIKQCHQGHEVEFVRRDRFFCDCGAGSTGTPCKLVKKDDVTAQSSEEVQILRGASNQVESRVHCRCGSDLARETWLSYEGAGKVVSTNEGS